MILRVLTNVQCEYAMCSTRTWEFSFSPNANIMLVDFAIHMKFGLIAKNKMLFNFVFKFFLHIGTELIEFLLVMWCQSMDELPLVGCH